MDKLKSDWKASAPFVFCDIGPLGDSGALMMDAFVKYTQALEDVVLTKLPELLRSASRVLDEAQDVKNYAEPQFERLDVISKGKAVMAFSFNMKTITKIPSFIEGKLKTFQAEMEEIKDAVETLKANMPRVKTDGAACAAKKIGKPVECHRNAYGPIKYTR